jgi:hypothetical protein
MTVIYEPTVGRLVLAIYSVWFGDIQASYGTFDRVLTYCGIATVTIPATIASLWLFKTLSHEAWRWKRAAPTFLGWEVCNAALLVWSYERGFPMMINSLGWSIFGAPEDIYGYTNLLLHRVLAWLICTTPVAWFALCLYSCEDGPRQ